MSAGLDAGRAMANEIGRARARVRKIVNIVANGKSIGRLEGMMRSGGVK